MDWKVFCFSLVFCMLFLCLQGCGQTADSLKEPSTNVTEVSGSEENTEKYLIQEGVCDYSIVYAAGSTHAKNAANKLAQTFQVKYKVTLKVHDSNAVAYDPSAKEIYIGSTGFAESADAEQNLTVKSTFCITGVGNKLVFVAGEETALTEAVEFYIQDLLPNCVSFNRNTGKASVKIPECVVKNASNSGTTHSAISIGGVDLKQFTIVYEEESENLIREYAMLLRDAVISTYGAELPVVGDQSSAPREYEILIGSTNRDETAAFAEAQEIEYLEYDIGMQGKKYVIAGAGYFSVKCAVQRFISAYLYTLSDKVVIEPSAILKKEFFVGTVPHAEGSDLRLMTLNVMSEIYAATYYGDDPPTPPERIEIVLALLEAYSPDLVGLQEMTPWWQETFAKYLDPNEWGTYSAATDRLAHVILYRKTTVMLLESETVAYSESSEFGNAWMVWGKFQVKASGKLFFFSTTHWHPTNEDVKDAEAELLANRVAELHLQNPNIPVFCTGDYNTRYSHERHGAFMAASGLRDAFDIAKESGNTVNEVNGNGTPGMVRGGSSYTTNVDHIYCEPYVTVGRYESVLENQITNLTDHAPRYADVSWK